MRELLQVGVSSERLEVPGTDEKKDVEGAWGSRVGYFRKHQQNTPSKSVGIALKTVSWLQYWSRNWGSVGLAGQVRQNQDELREAQKMWPHNRVIFQGNISHYTKGGVTDLQLLSQESYPGPYSS